MNDYSEVVSEEVTHFVATSMTEKPPKFAGMDITGSKGEGPHRNEIDGGTM